jgi:hypothetical protein
MECLVRILDKGLRLSGVVQTHHASSQSGRRSRLSARPRADHHDGRLASQHARSPFVEQAGNVSIH